MSAQKVRRPLKLSEMFPDSRLKEVTDLLGADNESLRSLKELVAEERFRERQGQRGGWGRPTGAPSDAPVDSVSGGSLPSTRANLPTQELPAAAFCWPPDEPDP